MCELHKQYRFPQAPHLHLELKCWNARAIQQISDPEAMVFIVAARPLYMDITTCATTLQGTAINLHGILPGRWYSWYPSRVQDNVMAHTQGQGSVSRLRWERLAFVVGLTLLRARQGERLAFAFANALAWQIYFM